VHGYEHHKTRFVSLPARSLLCELPRFALYRKKATKKGKNGINTGEVEEVKVGNKEGRGKNKDQDKYRILLYMR
jgi:uncharacterized UBP type Zn finger protein